MTVRAKLKLNSTTQHEGTNKTFHFNAVYDDGTPENKRFSKFTPSGNLDLQVMNTEVLDQFEIGKEYYIDFVPAD